MNWFVAADDRWHVPAVEPTVRQQRLSGTPVTETRVRVPHGDVVHTVYTCADAGGVTVIEVVNESTLPVAIAFDRRDVMTERPIADVPIEGIELPAGSFVLALGHRARLRVGIGHGAAAGGALPAGLPSAAQVVGGWLALTEQASRFVLPDGEVGASLAERVTSQRCELVLGALADPFDDPAAFSIGLDSLVRMGERPDRWLVELAGAVERLGPVPTWEADVALAAAARTFAAAGERRAVRRCRAHRRRTAAVARACCAAGQRVLHPVARVAVGARWGTVPVRVSCRMARAVDRDPRCADCRVVGSASSSVSLAVRWHGARPAVLWEQAGAPIELSAPVAAPGWTAEAPTGEALWPQPEP